GTAVSGGSVHVTWTVVNNGIGITDDSQWSDQVWLSSNPDGTGVVALFGTPGHIGQLGVGGSYTASLDATLPQGIQGTYYFNVKTGGPFEFIYDKNNQASSSGVTVTLAPSPDLIVESASLPQSAQEGGLFDISWTVLNQGVAAAGGLWADAVSLVPVSGTGG